jgi:hypothetical protein
MPCPLSAGPVLPWVEDAPSPVAARGVAAAGALRRASLRSALLAAQLSAVVSTPVDGRRVGRIRSRRVRSVVRRQLKRSVDFLAAMQSSSQATGARDVMVRGGAAVSLPLDQTDRAAKKEWQPRGWIACPCGAVGPSPVRRAIAVGEVGWVRRPGSG